MFITSNCLTCITHFFIRIQLIRILSLDCTKNLKCMKNNDQIHVSCPHNSSWPYFNFVSFLAITQVDSFHSYMCFTVFDLTCSLILWSFAIVFTAGAHMSYWILIIFNCCFVVFFFFFFWHNLFVKNISSNRAKT